MDYFEAYQALADLDSEYERTTDEDYRAEIMKDEADICGRAIDRPTCWYDRLKNE